MTNTYWAISGLGWGKGETPEKAVKTYLRVQRQNFRHLSAEEILEARGQVLLAPEGATGFAMGFEDSWLDADGGPLSEIDYPTQVVAWIGALPPWAEDPQDETQVRMAALPVLRG